MNWGILDLGNSYDAKADVNEIQEIFFLEVGLAGNPPEAALFNHLHPDTRVVTLIFTPKTLELCQDGLSSFNILDCERPKVLEGMICGTEESRKLYKPVGTDM